MNASARGHRLIMNNINYFNALNNTKLTKENLLCTLCSSWLSQPIFITSIGQNTCICAKGKVYTRNKPLELQLAGAKYPCYNMNCFISSKIEDFPLHEKLCRFAELQCPLCEELELNEYSIVDHLKEHQKQQIRKKMTQTVFSYQVHMPKVQLNMSTSQTLNTIHVIMIQNSSCMVVLLRPSPDYTCLSIGQLHSAENQKGVEFNFIQNCNDKEISTKRKVVSMRNLFNVKFVSANLEQFSENVTLYFANFEKCTMMECPICMEYLTKEIYHCRNQHAVCSTCKPKIHRCPTCRFPMRNKGIDLTRMLPNVVVPCANVQRGCLVFGTSSDHDTECQYKSYQCPWKDCIFSHCQSRVIEHMKENHFIYHMGYGFMFSAENTFAFIERDGELFKVYIDDFDSDIVQFNVQMYFNNQKADKLRYNIKIFQYNNFTNQVLSVGNVVQQQGNKKLSCSISISSINGLCNYIANKRSNNTISFKVYIF